MSGRVPQEFIDDLLARTDIVEIIDSFVPLKKAGKNHQALCPFHDEKTPSFTVSGDKQFYHCFGCGANGTAISFLMDYRNTGFVEAIEELASRAGLEVPRDDGEQAKRRDLTELYELTEMAVRFYRRQLKEHEQAARAVDYLRGRGITGEIAAEFELGFAPPGWDALLSSMGGSPEAEARLARAGLIVAREGGGYYDRFRDRIMFPIRDARGRAIGFGGRVLGESTPKYLNSPETPIFHKGLELYGFYPARKKNRDLERIYLVEGYMDVLALAQHGVTNAVASLGTAATREHVEKAFRATSQIVFCFDGDEAGERAAWRALETSLPLLRDGRRVDFLFMPEGEDPDSFIRARGREGFEGAALVSLTDHLVRTLEGQADLRTREGRAGLAEASLPYLRRLPDGVLKNILAADVARLAGVEPDAITERAGTEDPPGPRRRAPARPPAGSPGQRNLVSRSIALLLARPSVAKLAPDPALLSSTAVPGSEFLMEMVEFVRARPEIRCAGILEHWRGSRYERRLNELAASAADLDEAGIDLESEFRHILERLTEQIRRNEVKRAAQARSPGELTEADRVLLSSPRTPRGTPSEK